jgi:purine-binding chemotaxis protein CheW
MANDEQPDQGPEGEDEASSTYLTFDLGEQILGIEVRHVREILDMQRITRLPNAPHEVLGVVDVRGASVPIVDLKDRLGIPALELGEEARIVVIEIDAGPRPHAGPHAGAASGTDRKPIGLLADRVRNVDQIGREAIEPSPHVGVGHWDARILKGLSRRGQDLVALLDLERVFDRGSDGLPLGADPF